VGFFSACVAGTLILREPVVSPSSIGAFPSVKSTCLLSLLVLLEFSVSPGTLAAMVTLRIANETIDYL
jgi:hypothetical protein